MLFFIFSARRQPAFCKFDPDPGPCKAAKQRWFYNKDAKKCEQFTFGGCRGNHNNFALKTACETYCVGKYVGYINQLLIGWKRYPTVVTD